MKKISIEKIVDFVSNHILALLLISYFVITAGVIYDMINEPPAIGQTYDRHGNPRMESIMKGRQNGQYIIEGFCAAGFFLLIGGGMILVDKGLKMENYEDKKTLYLIGGCGMSFFGFVMIILFSGMKFGSF